jgi:hypothetical protein
MFNPIRALLFGSLLLSPSPWAAEAAPAPTDTSGLQFLGFRAGAALQELALHLRSLGGGQMRCRQSKADARVTECRAVVSDTSGQQSVEIWISAIDSMAGVIMLSGVVPGQQLEQWRGILERRYGVVDPRVQGTQSMLQWVRRGRMLRLTWRTERGRKVASISLVDGRVLDAWGRSPRRDALRGKPS